MATKSPITRLGATEDTSQNSTLIQTSFDDLLEAVAEFVEAEEGRSGKRWRCDGGAFGAAENARLAIYGRLAVIDCTIPESEADRVLQNVARLVERLIDCNDPVYFSRLHRQCDELARQACRAMTPRICHDIGYQLITARLRIEDLSRLPRFRDPMGNFHPGHRASGNGFHAQP